ncbi:MAG: hypothetical protein ABJG78_12440 [Cyclobacteriaceae bacterium]
MGGAITFPNGCPTNVRRGGFLYELELWHDKACMFSKTDEKSGRLMGYEVFKAKLQKERVINGRALPERFHFPHNEAFGEWAWSYQNLLKAIKKFKSLWDEQ